MAVVFVAGAFISTMWVDAAKLVRPNTTQERDNLFITDLTVFPGDKIVLLGNAGIGGLSTVEITWNLGANCELKRVDGSPGFFIYSPISDSGIFGGNPSQSGQDNLEAVVLTNNGDICEIKSTEGQYISISTVGSTP